MGKCDLQPNSIAATAHLDSQPVLEAQAHGRGQAAAVQLQGAADAQAQQRVLGRDGTPGAVRRLRPEGVCHLRISTTSAHMPRVGRNYKGVTADQVAARLECQFSVGPMPCSRPCSNVHLSLNGHRHNMATLHLAEDARRCEPLAEMTVVEGHADRLATGRRRLQLAAVNVTAPKLDTPHELYARPC